VVVSLQIGRNLLEKNLHSRMKTERKLHCEGRPKWYGRGKKWRQKKERMKDSENNPGSKPS
jgi:hypothetical protein